MSENNTSENLAKLEQNDKTSNSYFEKVLNDKKKININYEDYDYQKGEQSPRFLFRKRRIDPIEYNTNNILNTQGLVNPNSNSKEKEINLINFKEPNKEFRDLNNCSGNNLSNISCHSNNSQTSFTNNCNPSPSEEESIISKINFTFDNYLDFVHDSYFCLDGKDYTYNQFNLNESSTGLISQSFLPNNLFKFSSLDLLVNPLREKFVWETWSPYEVALFECCVCKFSRNFDLYQKIVRFFKN
jgi:hypothetical protein